MKGSALISAFKRRLGTSNHKALAKALLVTHATLLNWNRNPNVSTRVLVDQVSRLAKGLVTGDGMVDALKRELGVTTLQDLGKCFGITLQAIQRWREQRAFTARQIARIIRSAQEAAIRQSQATSIRTVVEFFPLAERGSEGTAKYEVFSDKNEKNGKHPYLSGLKEELKRCRGIYIFFDSRGRAIYAGKARRLNLWTEMSNAFNRDRGSLQTIKRVRHPVRQQAYKTSEEMARQIMEREVPLRDLAAYFSAYEVTDGLIGEIESLLVRSFANDLLNKRMERFHHQRNSANRGRRSRGRGARRKIARSLSKPKKRK